LFSLDFIFAHERTHYPNKWSNSEATKKTSFYVIGISYKKADAKLRGDFSLSPTKKARLLNQAKTSGIQSIVATSTCNRTEIYGFVNDPNELVQLLCKIHQGGDGSI